MARLSGKTTEGMRVRSVGKNSGMLMRDEDELSTSAGSSDTETSSNEEPSRIASPLSKSVDGRSHTGFLQQILAVFSCSRRRQTTPSSSLLEASATNLTPNQTRHTVTQVFSHDILCADCADCADCDDGVQGSDESTDDHTEPCTEQELETNITALPETPQPACLPLFRPPPGLPPPPGLEFLMRQHGWSPQNVDAVQQVSESSCDGVETAASTPQGFSPASFHKELVEILRDLATDRNTGRAVQRVRAQNVPVTHHATEFADLLTRAMETRNGITRRSMIAFCAGIAGGHPSAFDHAQCAEGLAVFFREVYPDLCAEVPKLPALVAAELIPTLEVAFPAAQLRSCMPKLKIKFRK